jgi:hypothetical protein
MARTSAVVMKSASGGGPTSFYRQHHLGAILGPGDHENMDSVPRWANPLQSAAPPRNNLGRHENFNNIEQWVNALLNFLE